MRRIRTLLLVMVLIGAGRYSGTGQSLVFHHLGTENGLSQSSVLAMAQDSQGFMWFGTRSGLNKYDTRNFKVYKTSTASSQTLSNNYVLSLLADSRKHLWAGTVFGLNLYDAGNDVFRRFIKDSGTCNLSHNTINCIYEDKAGHLWVGTANGLNMLTDLVKQRFINYYYSATTASIAGNDVRTIYEDHQRNLWVGTSKGLTRMSWHNGTVAFTSFGHLSGNAAGTGDDYITSITEDAQQVLWIGTQHGLYRYDAATEHFIAFVPAGGAIHNNVRKIVCDKEGRLWIGTLEGLSVLNTEDNTVSTYQHDPENVQSIGQNSIYDIFRDANGSTWVGTYYAGVSVVYAHATSFTVYRESRLHPGISHNVVSAITEDEKHNLWIGTEGGGLNYFDRQRNQFTSYKNKSGDAGSISSNLVKAVYRDKNGLLWIGTHSGGLNVFNAATGRFQHYRHNAADPYSLSSDDVIAILEDSYGRLWIGTDRNGLNVLDRTTGRFEHYATDASGAFNICNDLIKTIYEDSHRRLWVGTGAGLILMNENGKNTCITAREGDTTALQSGFVNCIREDSNGNIWCGTYFGGLSMYHPDTKTFTTYQVKDGLPGNNIAGIVEDGQGYLWVSTDNGLSRFDIANRKFKNYNADDGIAANEFNYNSFYKDSKGQLFFGGYNGLTAFFPRNIDLNDYVAPVVFTSLKLFNKPVTVHGADALLARNITLTDAITFKYDQNIFTIDFALLNYIKPGKNKFAYKLEGFEKNWNYVIATSATYTNLPAGTYTFLVKGANNDGVWNETPARMEIKVLPPFWRTWWAWTLYVLVVAGLLFLLLRFFYMRALFRREHELHQFKLNFFTNISHEIRTHLTLITGPVEKLMLSKKDEEQTTRQLEHVKNNADRLLNLVSELMDFRRAETNNLPLHVSSHNLVGFVQDIYTAFLPVAAARSIQLIFTSDIKSADIYFDKQQLEKVFFNLLSNAIKFTPADGEINIHVQNSANAIAISITDNGKGIAPEHLSKLFVNFFQVHDAGNTGYGIGLALSKSITELHKGTLAVQSKPAAGDQKGSTTFTVTLLKGDTHFNAEQLQPVLATGDRKITVPVAENDVEALPASIVPVAEVPVVLLVEDNAEVRAFIRESLQDHYHILESVNGAEGWTTATEQLPDLVISDVMMAEMDGLTLCRQLKTDERTSHIPVILLTARTAHTAQVDGLQTGADVYITKPFSIEVLQLQVRNLLAARAAMRQKFSREITLQPRNTVVNTLDEQFLDRMIALVEEHMDNPDFGVAMVSEQVNMSQPVLYKKLKALTDMSVHDFIKSIRLKKAAQLLQQKQLTVYEVAYAVGYSDRKYFSREFKKQFGVAPSDWEG
ncbi:MAG: two-component regulator propeller domain-containing protein [Chitinophagaceae bacterium]